MCQQQQQSVLFCLIFGMDFFAIEEGDDLEVLEIVEFGLPRQIYERRNYFNALDDVAFRRRFRLTRETTLHLLGLIDHRIEYPYDLNNSVSPLQQLLITLRLYSTGGHLQEIADFGGMHVSTVSRIVSRVTMVIADLYAQYVQFPNHEDGVRQTQQKFYNTASFPRVLGALDCTHIRIQSPGGEDAEIYRNRKQYFSINTQAICDSNLKFVNLVARWPGSVHDSTIFNSSTIKHEFENNRHPNCLLLGDSGYPCTSYLLTPLLNPVSQGEQLYNESQIRTRNCIERCFGVWKRRFPILAYGCRLKIETVLGVIIAAGVLHNIALEMGDNEAPPLPEELDQHVLQELIDNGQIPNVPYNGQQNIAGAATRRRLILEYFSQL